MPWLVRADEVLASLEVATTVGARSRGLLGRDGLEGALLLRPAVSVHSVGMRFDIDVAFCDRDLVVIATRRMRRWRMSRPRLRCRAVLEAEAGAFERWHLAAGDRLEIQD